MKSHQCFIFQTGVYDSLSEPGNKGLAEETLAPSSGIS